jgi:hypothetical protein
VKVCDLERSLQSITKLSCAAAVFSDKAQEIIDLCDIRIEESAIRSGAIKISDNTYYMHSQTPGIRNWQLSCPFKEKLSKTIESCMACMIQVPCGCMFTAPGEFIVTLQLDGCTDLVKETDVVPMFPINLAIVYVIGQLNYSLTANSLSSVKWDFDIPPLKPIGQNWENAVERSQKYSADLKHLAKEIIEENEHKGGRTT